MKREQEPRRLYESNAYELFILVLTVLSLGIMVCLLLPLGSATLQLLMVYDNAICVIFLIDFGMRIRGSESAGRYFIHERGWLDLLGSIPSFEVFKLGALLRLARLSRLARIMRLLQGQKRKEIVDDVLRNRSQYAAFITVFLALLVMTVASVLVLQFESRSSAANIKTGGEALWWSIVTITTVGYGDFYPVTAGGRITAAFVMITGVGIIGSLASLLASVLVGQQGPAEPADGAPPSELGTHEELVAIRSELEALRASLETAPSDV